MKITDEKKERVKALLDEVYEILEQTDNYISIDVDNNGVDIYAMRGPFSIEKEYEIVASIAWKWLDDAWAQSMTRALTQLENEARNER